jgi:hypothetical protein
LAIVSEVNDSSVACSSSILLATLIASMPGFTPLSTRSISRSTTSLGLFRKSMQTIAIWTPKQTLTIIARLSAVFCCPVVA